MKFVPHFFAKTTMTLFWPELLPVMKNGFFIITVDVLASSSTKENLQNIFQSPLLIKTRLWLRYGGLHLV